MFAELVSVIVPVHNGEKFVGRTLDSVLSQTYRNIEVIVVDDGSTDRTLEIIRAAARRDGRVKFLASPHAGVSAARNLAISQSSGAMIAPVDADDLWHPQKIDLQVKAMQRASESVGLIYCLSAEIDDNDLIIRLPAEHHPPHGHILGPLVERNFLGNGSTPLIRRTYLLASGGYDPDQPQGAEDWKLYLALAAVCEFEVVPLHLVGYRKSAAAASGRVAAMAQSIDAVRGWLEQQSLDVPPVHWRRHFYFSNSYLSNQALIRQSYLEAIRFQLRACSEAPLPLVFSSSLKFALRLLFRVTRAKQLTSRTSSKRQSFGEFCEAPLPRSQSQRSKGLSDSAQRNWTSAFR